MTEIKQPVSTWLTAENVSTMFPGAGLKALPEGHAKKHEDEMDEEELEAQELQGEDVVVEEENGEGERPADSASKDEWLAFRKGHGYSDEEVDGLTKAQLQELEDR